MCVFFCDAVGVLYSDICRLFGAAADCNNTLEDMQLKSRVSFLGCEGKRGGG